MSSIAADLCTDLEALTTSELVDAAATVASELAARRPSESGAVCMDQAERLIRATDLQESVLARLIETVDRTAEVRHHGFPSTQAWLRSALGMRDVRAKERVLLARQLPCLPQVAERLAGGTLSAGHALAVAQSAARLDDDDRAQAETLLLDMADDGHSAGKVAAFGTRIRDVIAERDGTDRPPGEAARGYQRSWITSTRSLDGGRYLKGRLNPEDAAVFDGTLAPLAKPAGPDDLRDLSERTAAALSSALSGGHRATKVTLICDLDTLTGGTTPARLPDGTPIPAAHARRIALATGVSPLLLGPGHLPLYLGRRTRFATAGQRRVLEALYPACAVRGCQVPGTLCEIDHVDGWALANAPTDIDRLALTCGWHNRYKHTHPQRITTHKDPSGPWVYRLLPPPDHRGKPPRPRPWTQDNDGNRPTIAPPSTPVRSPPPPRGHHHPSRERHNTRQPAGP